MNELLWTDLVLELGDFLKHNSSSPLCKIRRKKQEEGGGLKPGGLSLMGLGSFFVKGTVLKIFSSPSSLLLSRLEMSDTKVYEP